MDRSIGKKDTARAMSFFRLKNPSFSKAHKKWLIKLYSNQPNSRYFPVDIICLYAYNS